jgi:outer membrane beta-barrel protein
VSVDSKFEIGGFGGWATDEPIYNPMQVGLLGTYHFDEFHGLNLTYASFMSGLTSNAAQIKDVPTLGYDYSKTFGPKSYSLLQYQFTAFYGKMSLGKSITINLHLYGLAGLGTMNYAGKSEMCYDLGIGQRFYFTRNMALRFDMRIMRYNGPNPASIASRASLNSGNLKIDDFATTSFLTTHLTVGLVWLM